MTIALHTEETNSRPNDTFAEQFVIDLSPNFDGTIYFKAVVGCNGSNGFKWKFDLPEGASGIGTMTALRQNNPNPIQSIGNSVDITVGGGFNLAVPVSRLDFFGYVKTGETGGFCSFLWAQNTNNATPTTMAAGATLTIIDNA